MGERDVRQRDRIALEQASVLTNDLTSPNYVNVDQPGTAVCMR